MIKRVIIFLYLIVNSNLIFSQINFNEVSNELNFNHFYFDGVSGAGVSLMDFDKDGYDDISIPTNDEFSILFFRNNGINLSPINLNITFPYQAKQILWIDFDNDFDNDLYITSFNGKNKLFRNNGFLEFEDVTLQQGLPDSLSNSFGASWADINNDGYIDLLQSYRNPDSLTNVIKLYLNESGNSFKDITNSSGITEYQKLPFCASFIDIDNDNFQDLYIANDKSSGNSMYYNNGNNTFLNISNTSNTGIEMDAMSVTIGDFNNDQFYDIYSTNLVEGSKMFVNNKDLTFSESASSLGISFNGEGWGAQFEDFDLDGFEDLYVSGSLQGSDVISSAYYSNIFGKYFELNNPVGLVGDTVQSYGNAVGDIDSNGLPDIVVLNNYPSRSFILKNTYSGNNNWLKVNLIGYESNTDAIGSKVKLYAGDLVLSRTKFSTEGYISQNSGNLFFGISDNNVIDSIEVYWPSGKVDKLYDINSNQLLKIYEGSTLYPPRIYTKSSSLCEGESLFLETGVYSSYLWSNGSTSRSIEITTGGDYFVKVSDAEGIDYYSDTLYISNKSSSTYQVIVKDITLNHTSSIEIIDMDTIYDYYVSLDNGDFKKNNFKFYNIKSGDHIISVRNESGCITSTSFSIKNLVKGSNSTEYNEKSISRKWMEVLLEAIRNDLARPPVHARNLFHLSSMMYDAFSINQKLKNNIIITPFLLNKTINDVNFTFDIPNNIDDDEYLEKLISFSSYNFIRHRFKNSVGVVETFKKVDSLMVVLDYDKSFKKVDYLSGDPRSIGNYIFNLYRDYGFLDNSNEENDYSSSYYVPINPPLDLSAYGNKTIIDPNRWQPLKVPGFIDQSGNFIDGIPKFISPEWGNVIPFSLSDSNLVIKIRDDKIFKIYHDPGDPPYMDTIQQGITDDLFKESFSMVSIWGSHLDKDDGVIWDISPNSIGNVEEYPDSFNEFKSFYNYFDGGDYGKGHNNNPFTNQKYETQLVPRGDYTRVLAEFWADGPDSETPPGHWFVILNEVNDSPNLVRKFEGNGEELDPLEWDIKSYFLMGGAMHDAAITAWSSKGYYDYVRPVSVIRYLSDKGQSSYPDSSGYNPNGFKSIKNYIELIKDGDNLVGENLENLGKIKLYTWNGFFDSSIPLNDEKGVGWIPADQWWPYQRPSFVTPPFAGYISGHSTYSSAAATVLEKLTGSKFFPGGLGEFEIEKDNFLVFEKGPSIDMKLQWATYRDAADQCALSRIWGGIHPYIDDIPGRKIGKIIGKSAFDLSKSLFEPQNILANIEGHDRSIKIFPNPVSLNRKITFLNESSIVVKEVKIIDLKGNIVFESNSLNGKERFTLFLSNLQKGIYIATINFTDGSTRSTRIILN